MEESVAKRIMPHSTEAEQSVIGSMIMDKDAIITASEIITKDDFYEKQYGEVFDAMLELNAEGEPVDLITLQNKLKEKDVPEEIASLGFVGNILAQVPTSANVRYYSEIVRDNAIKRKLIRVNENIANECYAGRTSVDEVFDKTERDYHVYFVSEI